MKQAQVIWSNEAVVDLEIIHDFIAQNSYSAANKIVQAILDRTKQIESFPESGAIQVQISNTQKEYRYLVEGNYKIIYSYNPNTKVVYIETIFDTRSDPTEIRLPKSV